MNTLVPIRNESLQEENKRLRQELEKLKANQQGRPNNDDEDEVEKSFTLMEDVEEQDGVRRDTSSEEPSFFNSVSDRAGWLVGLLACRLVCRLARCMAGLLTCSLACLLGGWLADWFAGVLVA